MAWNETHVTVVGKVVGEVIHRQSADGVSSSFFRVSSTERKYNRELGDWVDGEEILVGITCWRRLADNAKAVLASGDPVVVQGRLRIKTQESDGERRQFVNLDALAIGLDLSRCHSLQGAPEIVTPRTEDESVLTARAEPETAPF
jgi:single-strand DNA-binding protein